jgi:hypothetical protein
VTFLWLENLAAYSLQVAFVAAVAAAVAAASRLRAPHLLVVYCQATLAGVVLLPVLQPWRADEPRGGTSMIVTGWSQAFAIQVAPNADDLPMLIGGVLAAGTVARGAWLGLGCWRLRRYRRRSLKLAAVPEAAADLEQRLGVRARWFVSDEIPGPATYGLRSPVMLLPSRLCEAAPAITRAVAAHELVHVRRRDWVFVILEEAVRAALWFHPAVWWLVDRIRLHRERVVDEEACLVLGDRRAYLVALLDAAEDRRPAAAAWWPASP